MFKVKYRLPGKDWREVQEPFGSYQSAWLYAYAGALAMFGRVEVEIVEDNARVVTNG